MAGSLKVRGLPIRARLCWLTSWRLTEARQNEFVISRHETGENRRCIDVWPIRRDFLKIRTWEEARNFFSNFGPFRREEKELQKKEPSQEEITTVDLATVRVHQRLFKDFMENEEWYSDKPVMFNNKPVSVEQVSRVFRGAGLKGYESPSFTLKPGYVPVRKERVPSPFLDYEAGDVYSAIYASIYIDKMRGLRGGVCQREDCTNTFLTTDPRKRFCDGGSCSAVLRMQKKRSAERMARARTEGKETRTQPLKNRKTTRGVK